MFPVGRGQGQGGQGSSGNSGSGGYGNVTRGGEQDERSRKRSLTGGFANGALISYGGGGSNVSQGLGHLEKQQMEEAEQAKRRDEAMLVAAAHNTPDSRGYNGDGVPVGPRVDPRDLSTGFVLHPPSGGRDVKTKKNKNVKVRKEDIFNFENRGTKRRKNAYNPIPHSNNGGDNGLYGRSGLDLDMDTVNASHVQRFRTGNTRGSSNASNSSLSGSHIIGGVSGGNQPHPGHGGVSNHHPGAGGRPSSSLNRFSMVSPSSSSSSPSSSSSALSFASPFPFSPLSPLLVGNGFFDSTQLGGIASPASRSLLPLGSSLPVSPMVSPVAGTNFRQFQIPQHEIVMQQRSCNNDNPDNSDSDDDGEAADQENRNNNAGEDNGNYAVSGSCAMSHQSLTLLDSTNLRWFVNTFRPSDSLLQWKVGTHFRLSDAGVVPFSEEGSGGWGGAISQPRPLHRHNRNALPGQAPLNMIDNTRGCSTNVSSDIGRDVRMHSVPSRNSRGAPHHVGMMGQRSASPPIPLDWLCFHNPEARTRKLLPVDDASVIMAGIVQICAVPKNLKMIRKNEYDIMLERLLDLAIKVNHVAGKWMLTPSSEDVDELWKLVGGCIFQGQLGASAKVSVGKNRQERAGHAGPIVCIYVDDFRDREAVRKIVRTLLSEPFKAHYQKFPFFKPDFLTTKFGFHSGNMEYRRNVIAAQLDLQYGISREWLEVPVGSISTDGSGPSRLEILAKMTTRPRIGVMHEDIVLQESEIDKVEKEHVAQQLYQQQNFYIPPSHQQQQQSTLFPASPHNLNMLQMVHDNLGLFPPIQGGQLGGGIGDSVIKSEPQQVGNSGDDPEALDTEGGPIKKGVVTAPTALILQHHPPPPPPPSLPPSGDLNSQSRVA